MSNELTNTTLSFLGIGVTICMASRTNAFCPDGTAMFLLGLGIVAWTFSGFFPKTKLKYDKKRDNATDNEGSMLFFPMSGMYPSHNWKWWALRILAGIFLLASFVLFVMDFVL